MIDRSRAPRATGWEWVQTALLAGNLIWTTVCLGGYRPETMAVTGVLTCVLLAVHFLARAFPWPARSTNSVRETIPIHPATWAVVPFLLYAAANVLWITPVPWLGWFDWIGWAQMAAVFGVVLNGIRSAAARRVLFLTLVALAISAVLVACYQRFVHPEWLPLGRIQAKQFYHRGSGWLGMPNSLAGFLLLLVPAVGALAFRPEARATERVWWGWILAVLLFGMLLTLTRGAWISLSLAVTIWPLLNARWAWRRRVLLALVAFVAVSAVISIVYWASPKARDRVAQMVRNMGELSRPKMWRGAWNLFREHPVLGSGAGSYNVLFERHRPERFPDEVEWVHNDYLNTLTEHGAVGFLLWGSAAAVVVLLCSRRSEERRNRHGFDSTATRSGLAVGLLAFALQLFVEFHFKVPALAMAFAVVAALVVGRAWPVEFSRPQRRWARPVLALATVAAILASLPISRWYRGEAERRLAREMINSLSIEPEDVGKYRGQLEVAAAHLERAVMLAAKNGNAWADLSYVTALFSRVETERDIDLGRKAEAAAERALALSGGNYQFWVRRGVARNLQGRWWEAGNDFAQAVKLAPGNALAWYYQAEHLSRRPQTIPLAHGSLAVCLRLDPWNPPGVALRQRLAIGPKSP